MVNHKIREGLSTTFEKKTNASDAYISGSSTINYLLSTPALLTMVIDASCKLLDPLLPQEYVTVGKHLEFSHEHPTLIGETVKIKITVERIVHNTVHLIIEGFDAYGCCCKGRYDRTIVNKEKLMEIAYHRTNTL